MAKFAQIGYGRNGRGVGKSGIGYTYVVNDNVRTGDNITPVVTHYLSGKEFATTGKVLSRSENLSTERNLKQQLVNQEAKTQLKEKGFLKVDENGKVLDLDSAKSGKTGLKEIYTGKQVGARGSKEQEILSVSPSGYEHKSVSAYEQSSRGGNLAKYKETHPSINPKEDFTQKAQETFDSYSKQFMKGEQ